MGEHSGLCRILESMKNHFHMRSLDLSLHSTQGTRLLDRLLDIDISSKRFNNLTKEERDALYNLRDEPTMIIKGTDKYSAVVA